MYGPIMGNAAAGISRLFNSKPAALDAAGIVEDVIFETSLAIWTVP